MKVRYSLLADYIAPALHGKLTIVGVFDTFFRHPDNMQLPLAPFYLLARIEGNFVEGRTHSAAVRLMTSDRQEVMPPLVIPALTFAVRGPKLPLIATLLLHLQAVKVPGAGQYDFEVTIDGRHLTRIPMYVVEIPTQK